jgi:S-adenosylmethionine hydrolase
MNARIVSSILAFVAIFLASGCASQESAPPALETSSQAVALVIDLQEGFKEDTVVIRVNGREIFNKEDVSTDYSLGRADSVETQVLRGSSVRLEVAVPSQQLSESLALEVSKDVYLGVSVRDGKIDHQLSDEPFKYF